jgi:hypothetical protein
MMLEEMMARFAEDAHHRVAFSAANTDGSAP